MSENDPPRRHCAPVNTGSKYISWRQSPTSCFLMRWNPDQNSTLLIAAFGHYCTRANLYIICNVHIAEHNSANANINIISNDWSIDILTIISNTILAVQYAIFPYFGTSLIITEP